MIGNYWNSAWRNLMKRKRFSFINIFGLAIGMASALLILTYVTLNSALIKCTQSMTISTVCKVRFTKGSADRLLGKQLLRIWFGNEREPCRNRGLYPNRLLLQPEQIVKYGELTLRENQIAYAEPSFFRL